MKIKRGLEKACWKRPISDAQIEAVVTAVENEIEGKFEHEVPSRDVGEIVMKQLRQLDQVAFVRFASVYRQFEDVRDFVHELKPMLAEARRGAVGEIPIPSGTWVAPIACLSGRRSRKRIFALCNTLLCLRHPDRQAIGATLALPYPFYLSP